MSVSAAPLPAWQRIWQRIDIVGRAFYFTKTAGDVLFLTQSLFELQDAKVKKERLAHLLLPYSADGTVPSARALFENEPTWTIGHILSQRPSGPVAFAAAMLPPDHEGVRESTVCLPASLFWCVLLAVIAARFKHHSPELKAVFRASAAWHAGAFDLSARVVLFLSRLFSFSFLLPPLDLISFCFRFGYFANCSA